MNDTKEIELKELIFKQATLFLEDSGDFFPYGVKVKHNGEVVPVGVYNEDEYLPSEKVIEILEKKLSTDIKNKETVLAGIGIDVMINTDNEKGEIEKRNALMLKISMDGIT